jgi:ABC-type antimicrobial peptide transport system permease subunit
MYAVVRTSGDPAALAPALSAAIAAIDPYQPVADVTTLQQRARLAVSRMRTSLMLAVSLALLALTLAGVGVYAVLNFDVAGRQREFGVRMALGAGPGHIGRLVVGRGVAMTIAGVSLGVAGVSLLTTALPIGQIARTSSWTVALAGIAVVAAASMLALWIPARRARGVDPLTVLGAD